jgi:UDP-N-acetylglucosamine enolpyruvyl transferase
MIMIAITFLATGVAGGLLLFALILAISLIGNMFLKKLKKAGANFEFPGKKEIKVLPSPKLVIDKIQSMPYPGIHTDLQPEFGILATQTKGATLIHDPLFEGRLKYLEDNTFLTLSLIRSKNNTYIFFSLIITSTK